MSDDLISSQAAIDTIDEVDWYHQNKNGVMVHGANSEEDQAWYKAQDIYDALERVPSELRWIPCRERVPQKGELCIVWFKPHGGSEEEREGGIGYCIPMTGGLWSVQGSPRAEVSAWIRVPEPYKEEE